MPEQNVQEERLLRSDVNAAGWFEIAVRDLERARIFYEQVFGVQLTLQKMDEYELAMFPWNMDLKGAAGCLSKGPLAEPCNKGTLMYFNVTDINGVLDRVTRNGGKVIVEKASIGEHGYIGVFEDCEGNRLGLHSMK